MMLRRLALFAVVCTLLAFSGSDIGFSQEEPETPAEKVLRERSVYIPYRKLPGVFEKEGRGVFLPYERFQELWRAARQASEPQDAPKAPVGAMITEIANEAVVSGDVVQVTATLKLEVLTPGWHEVPLRLSDAAIQSATIGEEAARLIYRPKSGGYALLLQRAKVGPAQVVVELKYAKAFTKTPGQNTVSFQAPQAPVNLWKVRVGEAGVKVQVTPLIAATELPVAADVEETVLQAFVGAAPTVQVQWNPKAAGAAGLAALATAHVEQKVDVLEGVVRSTAVVNFDISRAELPQLRFEVPLDFKVVKVLDANVKQWEVASNEKTQTVTVQLFQPARDQQKLTVKLERFIDQTKQEDVVAPSVQVLDVSRQQGVLVVWLGPALRAEVSRQSGLTQLDAADIPASLRSSESGQPNVEDQQVSSQQDKREFAFRYSSLPYDLSLSVDKVQPRVVVDQLVEAFVEPESLTLNLLVLYNIERAGIFQLGLDIPAGYELRRVEGHKAPNYQEAIVDSHSLQGDDKTHLVVNLGKRALGKVALLVELERRLTDENLLLPTGETSAIEIVLPQVSADTVAHAEGRMVVYGPESLRINPGKLSVLRSVSPKEALQDVGSTRTSRFQSLRTVLSYASSGAGGSLTIDVGRRRPFTTARQFLDVKIEAGVVKYTANFFYDIRYSGVKTLRIDIPKDVSGMFRNVDKSIQRKEVEPGPNDPKLAEGDVAWEFTGLSEFFGSTELKLEWEEEMTKLEVGKGVDVEMPHLRPQGVDRSWGQIVISKSETIDLRPKGEPKSLRPIDPQHDLMVGAETVDAARAMEFHDADWDLTITATRYELEEIKRTSIERAVIRMVTTRSGRISVQALYKMRSARQRLEVELPSEVDFDAQPLKIDGDSVGLLNGSDKKTFFIPLANQQPEDSFVIELRYAMDGGPSMLALPSFPEEPAVQKVHLCAYLPQETLWLGTRGPWTEEQEWSHDPGGWSPDDGDRPDSNLIYEMLPNLGADAESSFQTGGVLYVFSTLRPEAGTAGALRLVTMHRNYFGFLLFTIVFVAGVLIIRRPWTNKLAGLLGLAALLLVLGIFAPTFAKQASGPLLNSAIGLVLLLWVLWYAIKARPHLVTFGGAVLTRMTRPRAASSANSASAEEAEPEVTEVEILPDKADESSKEDDGQGGESDA